MNGIDWTVLTQIKGAGTKSTASDYMFEDQTFLHVNTYYYQLKQVDYDHSQTYSPIISLSCLSEAIVNMRVFPNPASDYLSIKISCFTENAKGKLSLINSCGSEVYSLELNLLQGMNLYSLPISLPEGLNTVRLTIQDIHLQSVKQVIVNYYG